MIPTLHTDRLTLRPYQRSDWDAYRAFGDTNRIFRYFRPAPGETQ